MKNNQVIDRLSFLSNIDKRSTIFFEGKTAYISGGKIAGKIGIDDMVHQPTTYVCSTKEIQEGGNEKCVVQSAQDNYFFILKKELLAFMQKLDISERSKKKAKIKFLISNKLKLKANLDGKEVSHEVTILKKGPDRLTKLKKGSFSEVSLICMDELVKNVFDCDIIGIQFNEGSPLIIFNRRLKATFSIKT